MFLGVLNTAQREAFWTLANSFVSVDGDIDLQEKMMLDLMRDELGLDLDLQHSSKTADLLFAVFDTRQARAIALLEMLALGHSDSNYHAEECDFISAMAQSFGVPLEQVRVMEKWVIRHATLLDEAYELIVNEEK